MIAPFSKKYTDIILFLLSLAPILTHHFLSQVSVIVLLSIWIFSAIYAYSISNGIGRYNLGSQESNHSFAISLALFSPFLSFLYTDLGADSTVYLIQAIGFLCIAILITATWQRKIYPVPLIIVGALIGLESIYTNYTILWVLLMPASLYIMRSWSGQNLGNIITGYFLAIWSTYLFNFFFFESF